MPSNLVLIWNLNLASNRTDSFSAFPAVGENLPTRCKAEVRMPMKHKPFNTQEQTAILAGLMKEI